MRVRRKEEAPAGKHAAGKRTSASNGTATDVAELSEGDSADAQQPQTGGTRLCELLVQVGAISSAQLAEALIQQPRVGGVRIGRILVDAGALNDRQLSEALSKQLNIPLVDLSQ